MRPERRRRAGAALFRWAGLLALLLQLLAPPLAARAVAALTLDPFNNAPLCAGHDGSDGQGAPHHDPGCVLCHGCCAGPHAAILPGGELPPPLPRRVALRRGAVRLPQPRGPPHRRCRARDPPHLP